MPNGVSETQRGFSPPAGGCFRSTMNAAGRRILGLGWEVLVRGHIAMAVFFRGMLPVPQSLLLSPRPGHTSSSHRGRGGKMRRLRPTARIPLPSSRDANLSLPEYLRWADQIVFRCLRSTLQPGDGGGPGKCSGHSDLRVL